MLETNNVSPNKNDLPRETKVEELDVRADKIVIKYSIIASATNILIAIPGTKALVDVVGDTIAQYKMINELAKNYVLDDNSFEVGKIIAVIADNLVAKKVVTWIVDFIPVIGKFASALFDFAYTYCIGKVFKVLFRTAYIYNKPINLELIPEIIKKQWEEAVTFVNDNWGFIIGSQKLVLEKYELDIEKTVEEFERTGDKNSEIYKKNLIILREIYKNAEKSRITKKDFMDGLGVIAANISVPTPQLIKTIITNARVNGEVVRAELLALLDIYDEENFRSNIK